MKYVSNHDLDSTQVTIHKRNDLQRVSVPHRQSRWDFSQKQEQQNVLSLFLYTRLYLDMQSLNDVHKSKCSSAVPQNTHLQFILLKEWHLFLLRCFWNPYFHSLSFGHQSNKWDSFCYRHKPRLRKQCGSQDRDCKIPYLVGESWITNDHVQPSTKKQQQS